MIWRLSFAACSQSFAIWQVFSITHQNVVSEKGTAVRCAWHKHSHFLCVSQRRAETGELQSLASRNPCKSIWLLTYPQRYLYSGLRDVSRFSQLWWSLHFPFMLYSRNLDRTQFRIAGGKWLTPMIRWAYNAFRAFPVASAERSCFSDLFGPGGWGWTESSPWRISKTINNALRTNFPEFLFSLVYHPRSTRNCKRSHNLIHSQERIRNIYFVINWQTLRFNLCASMLG